MRQQPLLRSCFAALGILITLIASACAEDPQGTSTPAGPTDAGQGKSSMKWEVTDGCKDGRGIQLRFFDRTYGGVWPGWSEVYVILSGETRQGTLSCTTGANICYGAKTDPETSGSWGLDLNTGTGSRATCCNTCKDTTVTRRLTCD